MLTNIEIQYLNLVPSRLKGIAERLDTRTLAAIMFGQAMISGKSYYGSPDIIAKQSVEYADALVNELNKKKEDKL